MPSETVDHQPAKIIFPNKHRPEGLEFPACRRCNAQTKLDEAILAFVCRMAGSSRENAIRDDNRLRDVIGSLTGGFPGLLVVEEFTRPARRQLTSNRRRPWRRAGGARVRFLRAPRLNRRNRRPENIGHAAS